MNLFVLVESERDQLSDSKMNENESIGRVFSGENEVKRKLLFFNFFKKHDSIYYRNLFLQEQFHV